MERTVALLRGINISGKNKIAMPELVRLFESLGLLNVRTYLNSGNVLFDTEEPADGSLAARISEAIGQRFGLDVPVFVIRQSALAELLAQAPDWWGTDDKSIYDNLIFLMHDASLEEILQKLGAPSEGLERISIRGSAIFWSFDLAKHAKANWWKKTAQSGIGEHLTIRTANTCRKLCL